MAEKQISGQPAGAAEDIAATRAAIAKMKGVTATAANPSAPGILPVTGSVTPCKAETVKTTSGGGEGCGDSGSDKGGGSGGGSSGSNFFEDARWRNPRFILNALVAIIGSIALLVWAVKVSPDKIQDSDQLHSNQKISEATGAAPPGWTYNPSHAQPEQQAVAKPKAILYAKTFSCRNDTDRENGYAVKDIHYVDGNSQSLHVGSGCVLTQISGSISKLEGKGYRLSVADPAIPGNYFNCGDMGGSNDPVSRCASFASQWSGRDMRIAVLDNGYVNLN